MAGRNGRANPKPPGHARLAPARGHQEQARARLALARGHPPPGAGGPVAEGSVGQTR